MRFEARKCTFESFLAEHFPLPRRREIYLVPGEGVISPAVETERTAYRAGKLGTVDFAAGIYAAFSLDCQVELVCHDGGTVTILGGVSVNSGPVIFRGFLIESSSSGISLTVQSGTAILEDCEVLGTVVVAEGARLFVKNCGLVAAGDAVTVQAGGSVELISSRVTCLRAHRGSDVALYACRLEPAHAEGEAGSALIAEAATVYAEGCEFFHKSKAVVLSSCVSARFGSCAFESNVLGAIESTAQSEDEMLHLYGTTVAAAPSSTTAPLQSQGGTVVLENCEVRSPVECVKASGCLLQIAGTRFYPGPGKASLLEQNCTVEGESPGTPANPAPADPLSGGQTPAAVLDRALTLLHEIIGQEPAKQELRRIVQVVWAAGQRGGSIGHQHVTVSFMGPPGNGQQIAARQLAASLAGIGVLRSAQVARIGLADLRDTRNMDSGCGLYHLATTPDRGYTLEQATHELIAFLQRLPASTALVLDGEAERLRSFLRNETDLHRSILYEVPFVELEPRDLAAFFELHCRQENILVSREATRKLLIVIHTLYDGFGRQFSGTDGIMKLFLNVRRNYLARCASEGRLDAELEAGDITIPIHRSASALCARSAEFVTLCPSCSAETPWLPALAAGLQCLHCGSNVPAPWGILRASSYLRKNQTRPEGTRQGAVSVRSGAVSGRRGSVRNS